MPRAGQERTKEGDPYAEVVGPCAAQLVIDSTTSPPVECGRSVETARRSQLADAYGYGCCRSHSRWLWGMRLCLCCTHDGTPRAAILAPADQAERDVAL